MDKLINTPTTEDIKDRLKCKYLGFKNLNKYFETDTAPTTMQMIFADSVARLSIDYTENGLFRVFFKVLKSKDFVFRGKTQIFDSCIDAMVWYEDWLNEIRIKYTTNLN